MGQGLFVDIRDLSRHLAHIPFALEQQLSLHIFKGLAGIISGFGLKKGRILTMKFNQFVGLSLDVFDRQLIIETQQGYLKSLEYFSEDNVYYLRKLCQKFGWKDKRVT
jgi:hypothetical protein